MLALSIRNIALLVFITILGCVGVWLPARWITPGLQSVTGGRVQLTEVAGTIWQGSARLLIAPTAGVTQAEASEAKMVFPERLSWRLHKTPLLFARAEGSLHFGTRPDSVFNAGFKSWSLTPGATALPAAQLTALGAPLNSMVPGGWVDLSWQQLTGTPHTIKGQIDAVWSEATTRLSGSEPLGDYLLRLQLEGSAVQLNLSTRRGRLQISGEGRFGNGPPRFRLVSTSAAEHRERLTAVLNMLGRRQNDEYILQIGS